MKFARIVIAVSALALPNAAHADSPDGGSAEEPLLPPPPAPATSAAPAPVPARAVEHPIQWAPAAVPAAPGPPAPGEKRVYWGVGLLAAWLSSYPGHLRPRLDLSVHWKKARYAIGADFRVATGVGPTDDYRDRLSMVAISPFGVRYFLFDSSFTPHFGAGVSWTAVVVERSTAGGHFKAEGNGPGGWLEAGLEGFRKSGKRLVMGVRVTFPAYRLSRSGRAYQAVPPLSACCEGKVWAAPIDIFCSLLF